jgi:FPC/CPF motif-containing protein YcgG
MGTQVAHAPTIVAPSARCLRYDGERLVVCATGEEATGQPARVHAALRAVVLDPQYPCLGARSVMQEHGYWFALYDRLATAETTAELAQDITAFLAAREELPGRFASLITVYQSPKVRSETQFERQLWRQLRLLHESDGQSWDPAVSSDPAANDFSFSFAGNAFFVVGLSPANQRWARSFPWPVLVFNSHDQFERLREEGRFERMSDTIRERDSEIEGAANPNLEHFGEHTEARQYAGREVGPDWRCPVSFTPKRRRA